MIERSPQQKYEADLEAMRRAAHDWKAAHPAARLKFRPIRMVRGVLIAALTPSMIRQVTGNATTRDLLSTLDRAAICGATVRMAEAVIEHVYGIDRALTKVRQ